jgi:flavin-dependent dehydrogenase
MPESRALSVIGGGPAGCAAALAALAEGASVTLYEKSRFPRHKVCGEFLSPEIGTVIDALNLWPAFSAARPARLARVILHIGNRRKQFSLPEPAYSLSRYAFDDLLLREAVARGADLKVLAATFEREPQRAPTIVAHGRQTRARKGQRLFGFKAHFRGPGDDAVEMFFFRGCYVGLSSVEGGAINVCGLAPEAMLRQNGFRPEPLFSAELRARLHPLEPIFDWLLTGPLVFRDSFRDHPGVYLAGDAMGFVDPFTGSGILAALLTGKMAGQAAARSLPLEQYTSMCRRTLARQYSVASTLRGLLGAGLAESLASLVPGAWLYRLTRPSL